VRRRALLIGSQTGGLRGVHADVEVMRTALAPHGFDATLVIGREATWSGIRAAYRGLIEDTRAGDAAVVYYSGHGTRHRNPLAGSDPLGGPDWLQYLVPVDLSSGDPAVFRGILAEELSQLQWALTAKTANVTTILDCCHAARMSRTESLLPKALVRPPAFPWKGVQKAWRQLRFAPLAGAVRADSNPLAVRLVACAPEESAYELPRGRGGPQGALTRALAAVLATPGSAELSWRELIAIVRPAVSDLGVNQRPEIEGPVGRKLFSHDEKASTGVLPVIVEGGTAYLGHPALFGLAVGDTFALVAAGGDPSAPLAVAAVDQVVGGRARLSARVAAWPPVLEAHPTGAAFGRRPFAVLPVDHPERARVVDALAGAPHVRIAGPGDLPAATVDVSADGFALLDALGEPLTARTYPLTAPALDQLVRDLLQLARAAFLRGLETSTMDSGVAAVCSLWHDGVQRPLRPSGEHLFVGDQVVVRLHNDAPARRYVTMFDVGLRGAVSLLTDSEPAGIGIEPGDDHEFYRLPGTGELAGVELFWPDDLPATGPRAGSFVVFVLDRPHDLRPLGQPGAVLRGSGAPAVPHEVWHFDFFLHPQRRPVEEPEFAVDERPDLSVRLVPPPSRAASRPRVRIELTRVDPVARLDAVVVTRAFEVYPTTARGPSVGLVLFEGPFAGPLELAVWSSTVDGPDLVDRLGALDPPGDRSPAQLLDLTAALLRRCSDALGDATARYRTTLLPGESTGGSAALEYTMTTLG
jgi:hypothetical protein